MTRATVATSLISISAREIYVVFNCYLQNWGTEGYDAQGYEIRNCGDEIVPKNTSLTWPKARGGLEKKVPEEGELFMPQGRVQR